MSLEDCENRGAVLDGKKCFCTPWNCWTNCLEVGIASMRNAASPSKQRYLTKARLKNDWTQNERETFGRRGTAALCA